MAQAEPDLTHTHHRDITGGAARAAVFGVSDGLTTNVALILGVAGANPGPGIVRLAGMAGLIGGAFSMAAGEWVSMRAQAELLERELAIERRALARTPERERRELATLYRSRGIEGTTADQMAKERSDAYLAEATDLYDLEFRMRKLDREAAVRHPAWLTQH